MTYQISECRESITGIGVVWTVYQINGRCGCGAVEMKAPVAFFVNKLDAEAWIIYRKMVGP